MTLLVLGGTSDARHMASVLHENGVTLLYSIAGLVRKPRLNCQVISGGFRQFGGLTHFIRQNKITAILNMSHPYAEKISHAAQQAAMACHIPYWRFNRSPWIATEADDWHDINNWQQLFLPLKNKKVVFLSAGQVEQQVLNDLLALSGERRFILRTAFSPRFTLPDTVEWIKAIGPFEIESELNLLQQYAIDVVVSKNSGGDAVVAKIHAARQLNIPVFMFSRPKIQAADKNFIDEMSCAEFVLAQCANFSR